MACAADDVLSSQYMIFVAVHLATSRCAPLECMNRCSEQQMPWLDNGSTKF